jgi:ABC-type branched-subunit amino acid transport system substrate-binding protein
MRLRRIALLMVSALVAVACGGHGVRVSRDAPQAVSAVEPVDESAVIAVGGGGNASAGGGGGAAGGAGGSGAGALSGTPEGVGGPSGSGSASGTGAAGAGKSAKSGLTPARGTCATTSNPSQGFTESTIKIGTILPLSGALRPLAEQVSRVLTTWSEEYLPENDFIPGPLEHLNWDCPSRPGIYGRRVDIKIYSLQSATPEEALAGMRRLIDVEKVFLVRDCYLTDSLMGPATAYQNSKGVPGIWCWFGGMPTPRLAKWNFNPGTDPLSQAAIHVGYLINTLKKQRLAILADPSDEATIVRLVRNVAAHLGRPIPDGCVIFKRSQEAPNGMRSEIARLRTCYGTRGSPDAVFAGDALQAIFGALEAKSQGWRPADAGVQWVCTNPSCWVASLAEVCGDACAGMITDASSLPAVPWADPKKYPAAGTLERTHARYFPGEPKDAITYGAMAISSGIAYWLQMTGPDLSRDKFRQTVESLKNWSSGIGPIINTGPSDHYGARALWLIRFTGADPWFADLSGDFLTLSDVGVPEGVVK